MTGSKNGSRKSTGVGPFDDDEYEYIPQTIIPDVVFCFDRDFTLSVNPPPPEQSKAVPLAWVKYLAHNDNAQSVDVWATGNQRLRAEAAIPGFREAMRCWEQLNDRSVFDVYERLHHNSERPTRRDGLRLIADLYHQPPGSTSVNSSHDYSPVIAVIDDVNLNDLHEEGFEYFHPDIFVTLVETTGGAPTIFENTDIEIPLDQLPTLDRENESSSAPDVEDRYANMPVNSNNYNGDSQLRVTHYDPTLE